MAKKMGVRVANKQIKIARGKAILDFDVVAHMVAYTKVDKKDSGMVYFATKELNRIATRVKKDIITHIKENYK